jgi:hypothetical protein
MSANKVYLSILHIHESWQAHRKDKLIIHKILIWPVLSLRMQSMDNDSIMRRKANNIWKEYTKMNIQTILWKQLTMQTKTQWRALRIVRWTSYSEIY